MMEVISGLVSVMWACLLQELAAVSPVLSKLIGSLGARPPNDNEVILFSSPEHSDTCYLGPAHTQVSHTHSGSLEHDSPDALHTAC